MSKGYLYDNGDELITREEALPDASEASQGDVLSLDSEKKPVWTTPSGGGGSGILIDATGEFSSVSFNEDTYSGTPISGSLSDYIDAVESGKTLIIVTDEGGGILNYHYPIIVTPVESYNMICIYVFITSTSEEAFIGYPEGHPNDLYFLRPTQV